MNQDISIMQYQCHVKKNQASFMQQRLQDTSSGALFILRWLQTFYG